MGQLEKAERIVRQLIEKDSSNPINYCLLGDITLKSDYYETAIKVYFLVFNKLLLPES